MPEGIPGVESERMVKGSIVIRRATVEDLPALKTLWAASGLSAAGLEKRVTDFQVALGDAGDVVGCVGMRLNAKQAMVHHEAFTVPAQAGEIRPKLWDRLLKVAQNHGLLRVWIVESKPQSFWNTKAGFKPVCAETAAKLPADFGAASDPWQVLTLREESETLVSMEKELEAFQKLQRLETEALMQRARVYRVIAAVIATAFLLATVAFAAKMLGKQREPAQPSNQRPPAATNALER